ncbi:MAG: nucleotide-binding universal stress UspA family protein [Cryomorphaceae bacterium]|jgi:nucleotide-binding universal stress UspA family protein
MTHNANTYNKIIVAVENDELDEKLCSRATRISELFGSKIKLVHVTEPLSPLMIPSLGALGPVSVESDEYTKAMGEHTRAIKSVKAGLLYLANNMISPAVTTKVIEATDVRAAFQIEAEAFSCDLIIVGSWGRSGLAPRFGGATASNILKNSPCDILAISMN